MKIHYIIPFAIIIIGLGIFFYSYEGSEELQPITIAINIWPGYANAFIAQEKEFFNNNGVNVKLILTETYTQAQELYINGDVDGIFEVYTDTIFHNSEGIKSQVVFISDYSDTADVLIEKQIFASDISNLKGSKMGVEGINSFSHIFILKILEKSGITEADVRFVDIPAMNIGESLNEGIIDAGHTWDPVKSKAIEDGYVVLATAGEVPGLITDVLVFRKNVVGERQEDVQKIVKSMIMARDFVYSNQNEALVIMANAESMDVQSIADGINGVIQPDVEQQYNNMKDFDDTKSLYETGRIFIEYYLQRGQINSNINLDEIIKSEFIENIYRKST